MAEKEQNKEEWVKQESIGDYWNPSKTGDTIIGKVVSEFDGNFGRQLVVKTEDSDKDMVTPAHTVLQQRLSKVTVGDTVKIVYVEEQESSKKGHNPAKIYDVFVKA